jgi:hypothetical protein
MLEELDKDNYWAIVEDCLVELHGWSRDAARARCLDLRRGADRDARPGEDSIAYHAEPLYVANDLAGVELDDGAVDAQYRAIQARYWPELFPDIHAARPA